MSGDSLPQTPSFRLDGRVALVAGASSGIGRACAAALAGAGARVVCAARREAELESLAGALREQGGEAEPLVLDISDAAAVRAAFAGLERLDVFVNSAGTARHCPALETEEEDFDAVAGLNWRAAHFAAAAAARKMMEGGRGGSIITVSSQMGKVGGPERSVYAASKHAVEGMTKSMALEWAQAGVRVNTICPTFIATALTEGDLQDPERGAWIRASIPLGRTGRVEDVMGAVVYLASDAAALVTGSALLVDGGWTAA